jgi:hypothetical protein
MVLKIRTAVPPRIRRREAAVRTVPRSLVQRRNTRAATSPKPEQASPVRLTERLLSETREEIRRADARASHWLAMLGSALLALLTAVVGQSWTPARLAGADRWLWWSGCVCAAVALLALVLALLPRVWGDRDTDHVSYFGHVHRLRDPAVVRDYLERNAADSMPGLVAQLCQLSRLAVTKYRYTRIGTIFGTLAATLVAVSLL